MSGYRTQSSGSAIDRTSSVAFTVDGKQYFGCEGDTLASALIANGVDIVGRSFKYHRPRGIVAAGVEEPNALFSVIKGSAIEPNVRATEIELYDGLAVRSQNRWPSLTFDMMAANQLAAPMLGAGFYYKTFMGPVIGPLKGTRFWMFCEHFIRRAAGLGKADTTADDSNYQRMNAFCDVLVVGGGRTGITQALVHSAKNKSVVLCELSADAVSPEDRATLEAAGVKLLTRTTVWGWYDGNVLAALERVSDHKRKPITGAPRHRHWVIRASHVSVCTGALERPIVFPGNDRPGVMLASAATTFASRYGAMPGRSIAVFTNNDSAYAAAMELKRQGGMIATIIDVRAEPTQAALQLAKAAAIPVRTGQAISGTQGRKRLKSIAIATYDHESGSFAGSSDKLDCDTLLVSGGWSPVVHLVSQKGTKPVWHEALCAFVAPSMPEGTSIHGAAAGAITFGSDLSPHPAPVTEIKHPGKAFVDLQHDVTADDIRLAHREGFVAVEHLKRYTTLGMATDQGKTSNVAGMSIMADAFNKPIDEVGTTRFRPPYTAVSMGTLAAERFGDLFPERLTPMHDLHITLGAHMYAAGHWMRPESYNRAGESVEQAYIREARAVRKTVGIVDVSTLGKIDIQGPDAAEFLNRVYTNGFAKLPIGKARYGLMLREDGFAFDDGTTWRLAENRFLMTTTTANAGLVMQFLEMKLDVHWPDLRVHLTSVTDQWAGVAIAGPQSRTVLDRCVKDTQLDDETLPFMGIVHGRIGPAPVMICRLSFSGELAYEVYCGAHHGPYLWDTLMAAGRPENITPYGLEALGTLRIEKGHVTGAEIDGRTTARDLKLNWMLSSKKSFVGSVMMERDGLTNPDRWSLVGVKSRSGEKLKGGSHLVQSSDKDNPGRSLGHLTAMCFSPELKTYIGLALLEDGDAKIGSHLYATDPVRTGTHIPVEIVSHHMVDPKGERMHG